MLHACNAVDGTAGKLYPTSKNKERFTRTLRENYGILGLMGAPGIDLIETRFPVTVKGPTAPDGKPDLADVLYASIAAAMRMGMNFQMVLNFCKTLLGRSVTRAC
jgi:hypothetical protein